MVVSLFVCLLPTIFPKLDPEGKKDLGGASGVAGVLWPLCFMLGFVSTPCAKKNGQNIDRQTDKYRWAEEQTDVSRKRLTNTVNRQTDSETGEQKTKKQIDGQSKRETDRRTQ